MLPFRIRLFGTLHLQRGDTPLSPLESTRAASLLAYLLLHREAPQPRQYLAFLLWPDSDESQARTNRRHLLHTLRHAGPEAASCLAITPSSLQWRSDESTWLDVAAFDAALLRARGAESATAIPALQEAVALYRGDLLEGIYDDWLLVERETYRQRYGEALERLIALLEEAGDAAGAIETAALLLRHDPLHEAACRALMRLYAARGEPSRALRVYHACAAALERELGIEPAAETRALYDATLAPAAGTAAPNSSARPKSTVPFVGRAEEWRQLTDLWRGTLEGRSQVAVIRGEAGIGKTRLVEEFRAWCAAGGAATARSSAYPAEGELAFGPLVSWLRAMPLTAHVHAIDRPRLASLTRLLPELLTSLPERAALHPSGGHDQRQRLFDAAATALLAPGTPWLLVLDDVHWCDQETLHFLHYLMRVEPDAPLLVLATARQEELEAQQPLAGLLSGLRRLECLAEIHLGRLSPSEVAELATGLADATLTEADRRGLFSATEGNPLFVVEALRAGWRSDNADLDWVTPRVQTVIESRLAQLSVQARELVGLAAAIGREFAAETLLEAFGGDEATLVRGLDELWRRRIVREQGAAAYDFSHDLIREVAYRALSPALRRQHHLHVARALENLHEGAPAVVSGQIAAHYDRAGAIEPGIAWYQRAAESALDLHANHEAVRLLERAIALNRGLPRTPERVRQEITLLTALHAPLGIAEGFSSPRLAEAQRQAQALATGPETTLPSPILRSLAIASLAQGNFTAARDFGERLRARGEAAADTVSLVESAYLLGITAFWQGRLTAARQYFEEAIARYRPESSPAHIQHYGLDPKAICLSRLANTLWFLGFPAEAEAARDEALTLAAAIGHPATRATVWVFAAFLALDMEDIPRLREYTALLAPSRREREGRPTELTAAVFAAYLDVIDGQSDGRLDEFECLLDEPGQVDHAPGMRASIARVLVAARAAAGAPRQGLTVADRALDMGEVRLWEPEIRRLRAEFLEALGAPTADIAAELERAMNAAREQGAVSLVRRIERDGKTERRQDGQYGSRGVEELRE